MHFRFAPAATNDDNNQMKYFRLLAVLFLAACAVAPALRALEKQPTSVYHVRRLALRRPNSTAASPSSSPPKSRCSTSLPIARMRTSIYLTGWNEPGAALMIVGDPQRPGQPPRGYKEILFLPTRNLRMEKYTGAKLDAATPGVAKATGVDIVEPMTDLPADLNDLIADDRRLAANLWTQPRTASRRLLARLHRRHPRHARPPTHDVTTLTAVLRVTKDAGEIDLIKKASTASIAGQRVMMHAVKPGVTERTSRRQDDRRLDGERLRAPELRAHRRHRHQLHHAALRRKLPHHRRRRHRRRRRGMRVLHVRRPTSRAPSRPTATSPHASAKSTTIVLGAQKGRHRRIRLRQIHHQRPRPPRSQTRSTPPPTTTSTLTAKTCMASRSASTGCTASATWSASMCTIPPTTQPC